MNVVISNRSKAGIGKVEVSSNNQVGQVNFSKIAKLVGTLSLDLFLCTMPQIITICLFLRLMVECSNVHNFN